MVPRNPGTAYTGGDAFGGGPAFCLTLEQQRALRVIEAEHVRTVARGDEWTLVSYCDGPKIRATTVRALARMGAVKVRLTSEEHDELRRGAFGRWIGGTVRRRVNSLWVIPTPDVFARNVREERVREEARGRAKARAIVAKFKAREKAHAVIAKAEGRQ